MIIPKRGLNQHNSRRSLIQFGLGGNGGEILSILREKVDAIFQHSIQHYPTSATKKAR
jgi:hypothetical protein